MWPDADGPMLMAREGESGKGNPGSNVLSEDRDVLPRSRPSAYTEDLYLQKTRDPLGRDHLWGIGRLAACLSTRCRIVHFEAVRTVAKHARHDIA